MILEQVLRQWDDPYAAHELQEAEEIIHALRVEIAGKESVIKALHEDLNYYRKDWKDQMIQDQGLDDEEI